MILDWLLIRGDEAFWQLELEREVLQEIVADWGHWSGDSDMQPGKATD